MPSATFRSTGSCARSNSSPRKSCRRSRPTPSIDVRPLTQGLDMSAIEIAGVRKVYELHAQPPVVAIERVDLAIEKNEFVAIVGPSGCGKSTLLHMIGGFVAASEGE